MIMIGDSIIKGLTRYPNVWRKYFGNINCLNFGVGGDRVQHVLWRLKNGELDCQPKIIVLHCGTNNIGRDPPLEIAEGLLTIVDEISHNCPKTRIIVTGLLPRDLKPSQFRQLVDDVNKILMENIEFSDEMKNVFFLETEKDWVLDSGMLDESLYFTDHLHLVEAGDEKFAKAIRNKVDEVLKIVESSKVFFEAWCCGRDISAFPSRWTLSKKLLLENGYFSEWVFSHALDLMLLCCLIEAIEHPSLFLKKNKS